MSYVTQKGGLLYSDSVAWNSADTLGRGASAAVYLGRYKQKGGLVAVKVFHNHVRMVPGSDEVRELELLRKLKHENIISLFSVEKEVVSKRVVLIMQYCEGGSLYHMLDQPQYVYGLSETEFLLVLKHVATGISYLRQMGIVHRDIKPGNIMRFITEDGRSIYKLTDFGAARELHDEENFSSLYGTEEYLHPDMYGIAMLQQPTRQRFDAKVDLWSLGVTFYHVATGDLPFKPYGGRNNKQKMFEIISRKSSGDISGVQNFHQGPIIWSKHLPDTCPLSRGLQEEIVPLLAGLMEMDKRRVISYETFFHRVHLITNKTTLTVFDTMACQVHKLYLDRDSMFSTIQESIASHTDIASGNQLLLVDSKPLEEVVAATEEVSAYPVHVLQDPIFLFPLDATAQEHLTLHHPALPTMPEITNNVTSDARAAHKCTGRAHLIKRHTEHTIYSQELLVRAEMNLRQYLQERLRRVEERLQLMDSLMEEFRKRSESFYCMLGMVRSLLTACNCPLPLVNDLNKDQSLLVVHKKAEERVEEIKSYKKALSDRLDRDACEVKKWSARCKDTNCLGTLDHHLSVITSTYSRFKRDAKVRDQMSQHDLTIHQFESQKLETQCVAISSIPQDHCFKNLDMMHSQARAYCGECLKNLTRVWKVERNVESVVECQQKLSTQLDKTGARCTQTCQKAQEWVISRQNDIAKTFTVGELTPNIPSASKDFVSEKVDEAKSIVSSTDNGFCNGDQSKRKSFLAHGQGLSAKGQASCSACGQDQVSNTIGQRKSGHGQGSKTVGQSKRNNFLGHGQGLRTVDQSICSACGGGQISSNVDQTSCGSRTVQRFTRDNGVCVMDGHAAPTSQGSSIHSELSNELHSLMVESQEIASLVEENTQTIKLLEEHALCSSGSISRNFIRNKIK